VAFSYERGTPVRMETFINGSLTAIRAFPPGFNAESLLSTMVSAFLSLALSHATPTPPPSPLPPSLPPIAHCHLRIPSRFRRRFSAPSDTWRYTSPASASTNITTTCGVQEGDSVRRSRLERAVEEHTRQRAVEEHTRERARMCERRIDRCMSAHGCTERKPRSQLKNNFFEGGKSPGSPSWGAQID